MTKYTQKALKEMVNDGIATDITYGDNEKRLELEKKEGFLNQIGYACGIYGCSGKLFQGHNTKELYAITTRSQAIYVF